MGKLMLMYFRTLECFTKDSQLERIEEGLKMDYKRTEKHFQPRAREKIVSVLWFRWFLS